MRSRDLEYQLKAATQKVQSVTQQAEARKADNARLQGFLEAAQKSSEAAKAREEAVRAQVRDAEERCRQAETLRAEAEAEVA